MFCWMQNRSETNLRAYKEQMKQVLVRQLKKRALVKFGVDIESAGQ